VAGRRRQRPAPTLFPFLSVLLCAMGALIVVITGQSLVALAGGVDQVIEVPAGDGAALRPAFVECRPEGAVLQPEGGRIPLEALDDPDTPLAARLDALAADPGRYLVLLVRPRGTAAFRACAEAARAREVPVGKEAVLAGGDLVFRTGEPEVAERPR